MSEILSQKDLGLISAYLDDRLSQVQKNSFESRLQSEPSLKRNLDELRHTCTLLRALQPRRAPRNFTLSGEYARFHPRARVLSLTFGWVSGAAALALVALFVFTSFIPLRAAMPMAAPAAASLNEAAMDSASANPPQIITWTNPNLAYGRGGGGDASSEAPKAAGAESLSQSQPAGGGGLPVSVPESPVPETPPMTLSVTEAPQQTVNEGATADPSTLILGLPQPGTEGQQINPLPARTSAWQSLFSSRNLWLIVLGTLALAFAVVALFLRRR